MISVAKQQTSQSQFTAWLLLDDMIKVELKITMGKREK